MSFSSGLVVPAPAPAEKPSVRGGGFRSEIAALRAVAVLLVILYHLWPGTMPGGYIGVDVFFVISGFLITGHLLREVETTGSVRLGRFWVRRAKRLLPASYLVLAVTSVVTVALVPVSLWQQWFREIGAAGAYALNWVLAFDAVDYLAADNTPSPVQHYWTLSGEEQFYLLWPLLVVAAVWAATRLRERVFTALSVVLVTATFASFVYSLYLTGANPGWAYFITPVRAWQFGAGALLALWMVRPGRPADLVELPGVRAVASWAGFAALAYGALFRFDAATPFPGFAALLPVLATVLVIWAGEPGEVYAPTRLMRWRVTSFLSETSYSAYLWHWPIFIVSGVLAGRSLSFLERLAILVATLVVSWATKRYVEDPARRTTRWGMHRPARVLAATVTGAALILVGAGAATVEVGHRAGEAERQAQAMLADPPRCFGAASMDPEHPCHNQDLDDVIVPNAAGAAKSIADFPECQSDHDDTFGTCVFGPDDASVPYVALVGDSHARALGPVFVKMAEAGEIRLVMSFKLGCAWTAGDHAPGGKVDQSCVRYKGKLNAWLTKSAPDLDAIVTTGALQFLSGDVDTQRDQMIEGWQPLAEAGVTIVGISDNPALPEAPWRCIERLGAAYAYRCSQSAATVLPDRDPILEAAAAVPGGYGIDLRSAFCDADGTCPVVAGGVGIYRDENHVTLEYMATLQPRIEDGLREAGVL